VIDENRSIGESESPLEDEGESPLSDRSQHFVFSTMKNLNKEAILSMERNLLHKKIL